METLTAKQMTTMLVAWLSSSLFAFSAESQMFHGYLVWVVLWFVALITCRIVFGHQEAQGWRRLTQAEPPTPLTPRPTPI